MNDQNLIALKNAFDSYYVISDETWAKIKSISTVKQLRKGQFFTQAGKIPASFGFVCAGLLRAYIIDLDGNEYNKNFFSENTFPASLVALLTATPSTFSIEAIEDTTLIQIDFNAYRDLLDTCHDLKWFHIFYLEENWVLQKETREVAFVQTKATERYLEFIKHYSSLEKRIPQYHIASHLGITPTQLSRIRKELNRQ